MELPFRVHYRYDELEQTISAVSFGRVYAVQLTVLTSENAPPLVQLEHELTFQYASSPACGGPCPAGPAPLIARVVEPGADAGPGTAGPPAADVGMPATPADAGDAGREPAP